MTNPFFSIIIPALNEEQYLPSLLEDLVGQTFKDFEVIVVDGNSNDQTVARANAFKSKLSSLKILTSPKRHVCTQRNLGAKTAKSDILIFCDADNRLPPYFLQGIKYRWEESEVDILSCWIKPDIRTPQNDTIALAMSTFLELQNSIKPAFLFEAMIIISKACFKNIGGFDESKNHSEGKTIIRPAITMGYSSRIVRDPAYTTSFRRFRKYGIIKTISNIAKLELAEIFGPEFHGFQAKRLYPMVGGLPLTKNKRVKNKFLKNIAKIIKDF